MCGDDLVFWSGNDSDTVTMMALGAKGVISVASNLIPAQVAKLCKLCLSGDYKAASEYYFTLADFFDKIFIETNPIPIKTAMNVAGMAVGKLRLPLIDMAPANLEKLKESMKGIGLL
jgi:4-hydroxy-tetrahydrodipicolinate synthase